MKIEQNIQVVFISHIKEVCYYDEQNSFICYGDYYSEYCLVEIATDTYIGICDDRIVVVILKNLRNKRKSTDKNK